ncbi:hypothetical protein B5E41_06690 [Rhizobium esperanzae]|uniref:Uncharacterized protein n=1 Tax=Rhizobium esperanzae TaxID=1967781 RepID=A0A246DYN4_9HYPH|nr:hypothetical protein B5E41_06690 [Rhizobium esperanzae]
MDPRVKPEDDGEWDWPPLLACRDQATRHPPEQPRYASSLKAEDDEWLFAKLARRMAPIQQYIHLLIKLAG